MKVLVVSLQRDQSRGMQIRHRFLDVERETPTGYKVKTSQKDAPLLGNRQIVKKEDIDTAKFKDLSIKRDCPTCGFDYINMTAYALIEDDTPNYDLLRYWRRTIKEKAMAELKVKNQSLKVLYSEVAAL